MIPITVILFCGHNNQVLLQLKPILKFPSNFYQMIFQGKFDYTSWSCIDAKCCIIEMIKTYIKIMNMSTTFGQP